MNEHPKDPDAAPSGSDDQPKPAGYEPPELKKYGSLAELTRSGTGTKMEGGKGPPRDFA